MRRAGPADPPVRGAFPAGYAPRHAVGYQASGSGGHQAVTGAAVFVGLVLAAGVILAGSRTGVHHPGDVAQARAIAAGPSSAPASAVAYVAVPTGLGSREPRHPPRAAGPATPTVAVSTPAPQLSLVSTLAAGGIPTTALAAYRLAAVREAGLRPGCGLTWPLLAGIGRVESDHGRFAGALLHADGYSTPRIVGIPLDGNGTALIRDTDGGRWDGDRVYDRAVGPMQFIPSTWAGWGVDADHDGRSDPNDLFDAAAAAADYLCAAGGDVRTYAGAVRAVRSYNDSDAYIAAVLGTARLYAAGQPGLVVPDAPGSGRDAPATTAPAPPVTRLPPVDPGRPRGLPPGAPAPRPAPSTATSGAPSAGATSSPGTATAAPTTGPTTSGPATSGPASPPPSASPGSPGDTTTPDGPGAGEAGGVAGPSGSGTGSPPGGSSGPGERSVPDAPAT